MRLNQERTYYFKNYNRYKGNKKKHMLGIFLNNGDDLKLKFECKNDLEIQMLPIFGTKDNSSAYFN